MNTMSFEMMKVIVWIFFLNLLCGYVYSQDADCSYFAAYEGHWSGHLSFDDSRGRQTIACELNIEYLPHQQSFKWHTVYFTNDTKIDKDYSLKCLVPEKGHFSFDENNGIFLDAYLKDNKLISFYEVGDMYFYTEYEFEKERINFQISFFSTKAHSQSGGTSPEVPVVNSYSLVSTQKAIFERKK